jgi:hypothetical protein
MADKMVFHKTGLTSGGAGCLDAISGANRGDTNPLQADDAAFVMVSSLLYAYLFDAASTAAESSPDIIRPDDIAAIDPGRWLLQGSAIDITTYLGETSVLAYRGDRGKTAYDHSQVAHAPSDANNYVHPNHSGDVTSAADGAQTIASKAVHVSMLADGTDGELITWGTDGVATVVAAGTDGYLLTAHGAGAVPTWEAAASGGSLFSVNADNDLQPNADGTIDEYYEIDVNDDIQPI